MPISTLTQSTHPPVIPTSGAPLVSTLLPVPVATGFALSPSSEPFPQKLVDKVRSGQFVEMHDLLTDNIALMQKLETFRDAPISFQAIPGALRPRLREITSIVSWLYCYLAYVAMRTNDPVTVKMLAYGRLIIKEAQQHQGNGWLEYDRVFRKQATIDPSRAWNILHSDIHASTILGRWEPEYTVQGVSSQTIGQSSVHSPTYNPHQIR